MFERCTENHTAVINLVLDGNIFCIGAHVIMSRPCMILSLITAAMGR